MSSRIRVVIADDSPFVCELLARYLNNSPGIEVVATANDGEHALACVRELKPDVVTLDLELPDMTGLQVLRELMRTDPLPVVIITGASGRSATMAMQALDDGAVDFVLKFDPDTVVHPEALRIEIVSKVRAAARVRVIRPMQRGRVEKKRPPTLVASAPLLHGSPIEMVWRDRVPGGVIAIGASTGGPVALRQFLADLPIDLPAAIVVIQHMPASFTGVLAAQLNRQTELPVREAAEGDALEAGTILVAPGDFHLLFDRRGRVELSREAEIRGHRPSIDVTMQALAQALGALVQGVLLTGMGEDGVEGLHSIRTRGGITYAQDADSCVINGMPQRAVDRGVAMHVAAPSQLGQWAANQSRSLAFAYLQGEPDNSLSSASIH